MKRIIALLLTALTLLTITACGGKKDFDPEKEFNAKVLRDAMKFTKENFPGADTIVIQTLDVSADGDRYTGNGKVLVLYNTDEETYIAEKSVPGTIEAVYTLNEKRQAFTKVSLMIEADTNE